MGDLFHASVHLHLCPLGHALIFGGLTLGAIKKFYQRGPTQRLWNVENTWFRWFFCAHIDFESREVSKKKVISWAKKYTQMFWEFLELMAGTYEFSCGPQFAPFSQSMPNLLLPPFTHSTHTHTYSSLTSSNLQIPCPLSPSSSLPSPFISIALISTLHPYTISISLSTTPKLPIYLLNL